MCRPVFDRIGRWAVVLAVAVVVTSSIPGGGPRLLARDPGRDDGGRDDEASAFQWIIKRWPNADFYPSGEPKMIRFIRTPITDDDLNELGPKLAALKHLVSLDLYGTAVTDAGLKHLAGLENLEYLSLDRTRVTGAGLKELAGLKRLRRLSLDDTPVTDADLGALAAFKSLRELNLRSTPVTGAGLKALGPLDGLETLRLDADVVVGAKADDLKALKGLRSLPIDRRQYTDRVFRALRGAGLLHVLPEAQAGEVPQPDNDLSPEQAAELRAASDDQIRSLNLSGTQVTDAGLKEFTGLTNLRALWLGGTNVTVAGLPELARLKTLNCLTFGPVTDEVLRRLRQAGLLHTWIGCWVDKESRLGRTAREADVGFLNLSGNPVTDAGLKELTGLTNLRALNLSGTKVTGAGFQALAAFTGLRELDLSETPVTDAGLTALAKLKTLESINLEGTKVTDAGLKALAALPKLLTVTVQGTRLSGAELKAEAGRKAPAVLGEGRLLTTAAAQPAGYQIFVTRADGSGRAQLTRDPGGATDPAPSPDGRRIAFVAANRLSVMNADGTRRRPLAEAADLATLAPAWSPDGRQVAFSLLFRGVPAGRFEFRTHVVGADGTGLRPLGKVGMAFPSWSPDGKQVLLTRMDLRGGLGGSLWTVTADGEILRELVRGARMGAWSRDGRQLAYVGGDQAPGLFLARSDGTAPRKIADADVGETLLSPQWSADSQRLYFTKVRGKTAAVHAVAADGRNPRRVTPPGESEYLGPAFFYALVFLPHTEPPADRAAPPPAVRDRSMEKGAPAPRNAPQPKGAPGGVTKGAAS